MKEQAALETYDTDAGMAEAPVRLSVAIVHLVLRVVLGTVVVRQLYEALSVEGAFAMRQSLGAVVAEKVQVELSIGELELLDNLHTQELIEPDWTGRESMSVDGISHFICHPAWPLITVTYQTPWDPSLGS